MKAVSTAIAEYMNTQKHFECCDLYMLTLSSGSVYRIADYDKPISYNGNLWTPKMIFQRGQVKTQGKPNVDTLAVTISCDVDDIFDNMPFMKACHDGLLTGGVLTLYRAFISNGQFIGAYPVFSGKTEVQSAGGLSAKFSVKAETQGLNQQVPLRIFAPQSAYKKDSSGDIVVSESDTVTMLVPLKPSNNVLLRL